MKIKISQVTSVLLICGAFILGSCGEPYDKIVELEQFKYIFISGATEYPADFAVEVDATEAIFPLSISYGGTTNYEQGDISAEIEVINALVDTFNVENGTSYLPLPNDLYSLGTTTLKIENGNKASNTTEFSINPLAIDLNYEYLVPVTIKSISGGNIPLSEELKTTYILIRGKPYDWEKPTWGIVSYKSQWNDDWAVAKIFDGNKNTSWHSDPSNTSVNDFPQWFIVDMKKMRPAISGFLIWNRQDDTGQGPKHVVFSISEDNENWTVILDIPEMSQDQSTELDYIADSAVPGRYLKVEVLSNWGGNPWTYFGEITVY